MSAWDRAIIRKTNFAQIFRVKVAGNIPKTVKMRARPIFDGKGVFKEFVGSISLMESEDGAEHLSDDNAGNSYLKNRELHPKKHK